MSISAKQTIMQGLAMDLGKRMTVDEVTFVMESLSDHLSRFEVDQIETSETDRDSADFLQAFLAAKRIEGRSPKTLERYEYVIKKAMAEINVPIRQVTVYHLRQYLSVMKDRGLCDRTLEGLRCVFSSYFGWLNAEGLLPNSPCANLGAVKYLKTVRQPFSVVEIEKIRANCKSVRDQAIVHFLLSTGCRISEVCALNRADIDPQRLECVVLGKGNKQRTVFLDEVTSMLIQDYLGARTDSSEALFVGKGSSRMTPGGIRNMLAQTAKRAVALELRRYPVYGLLRSRRRRG